MEHLQQGESSETKRIAADTWGDAQSLIGQESERTGARKGYASVFKELLQSDLVDVKQRACDAFRYAESNVERSKLLPSTLWSVLNAAS